MSNTASRRSFIKRASLAGAAGLSIPQIVSAAFRSTEKIRSIKFNKGDVVLFQGDSITDAHRKRDEKDYNSPSALGTGYAFITASELLYRFGDKDLKIYNKGISGNKVYQLAERWDADCLELKPNVLSILIGVNDFWHTLTNNYQGTIKTYHDDFQSLLERTMKQLPDVQLVIGEPFAVTGIKAVNEKWYPEFDKYREAARSMAEKFKAVFIPYQSVFDEAQKIAPGAYWTFDGVHPTLAGANLMAHAWWKAVIGEA